MRGVVRIYTEVYAYALIVFRHTTVGPAFETPLLYCM